ncbi:hypothetical protein BJ912DRAFT_923926 [Pholiota molesta]|nr:hypothetical protein BJ912DRAFT_923926 [Pholiota molesta]
MTRQRVVPCSLFSFPRSFPQPKTHPFFRIPTAPGFPLANYDYIWALQNSRAPNPNARSAERARGIGTGAGWNTFGIRDKHSYIDDGTIVQRLLPPLFIRERISWASAGLHERALAIISLSTPITAKKHLVDIHPAYRRCPGITRSDGFISQEGRLKLSLRHRAANAAGNSHIVPLNARNLIITAFLMKATIELSGFFTMEVVDQCSWLLLIVFEWHFRTCGRINNSQGLRI